MTTNSRRYQAQLIFQRLHREHPDLEFAFTPAMEELLEWKDGKVNDGLSMAFGQYLKRRRVFDRINGLGQGQPPVLRLFR